MFLPSLSDYRFSTPSSEEGGAVWVAGNREKTLFAVLSPGSLFIYQANPQILLCTFTRDQDEIDERGEFVKCLWRHDSAALCVLTNKHSVYIYGVDISEDSEPFNIDDRTVYDGNDGKLAQAYLLRHKHPVINVYVSVLAKVGDIATCAASLKDDLFVCLQDGWIHRITWSGEVRQELSFNIRNVPLSNDQVNAKYTRIGDSKVHVVDIVYCPLVGGLCVVLSDGRAALLASQNYKFDPPTIVGIWTLGLVDAVCCAANHKFRLLYFGCANGDVAAYHMDDTNGAMVQTFRIKLDIKDGTEFLSRLGRVQQIQCLPQGLVFAVTWRSTDETVVANGEKNGGSEENSKTTKNALPSVFAFFSPFGAQWWCSLEDASSRLCSEYCTLSSVEWGAEGFQLWTTNKDGLNLIHLSRSISVNQPSLECFDRVALLSADTVSLSPSRGKEKQATAPHCFWSCYSPPQEYISVNYPLRFAAFDEDCSKTLIVSGSRGFAHYQIKTGKWRLFRNENQEQNLLITGGVAVFQDHLIAVGADLSSQEEGIYAYSISKQIDQNTANKFVIPNRAMMINLRNDHMLTFDVASVVTIYVLRQVLKHGSKDEFECHIERCAEIRIHELLPHPTCVISMQLTSLNYHSEAAAFCHGMDSLLVNVSGHLLLLSPFNKDSNESDDDLFQLHQPMLIASNVERVWIHSGNREVPHLNKALWINAGSKSMKVWLPLFHTDAYEAGNRSNNSRSFISKRIMLPVELNLYPIAIDQDCLAGGIESFPFSTSSTTSLLVHNVTRNSEVFIHRLLRQLLKRNLGVYALEIATSCRTLPYFSHILELLLHDVLDEEATSSEPIPDPLLPRVVAFIHEFPEYLETIVHCARKTELAFWNLLFSVSHHPRELFKMCLKEDQLDTATSCLIILQSMESTIASVHHATILLEEALNKRRWLIARDIVRFLKSIDGTDLEETPESPLYQKLAPKQNKKTTVPLPNSADDYNLVFNSISVETHAPKNKLSLSQQSSGHSPNNQILNGLSNSQTNGTMDYSFMSSFNSLNLANQGISTGIQGKVSIPNCVNEILEKHADVLIEDYAIRDLGAFSSHLEFDLMDFFKKKNGAFNCNSDDFPLVLMKLHSQFKWPYPVVGDVIDKLIQRISAGEFTPSASEDEQQLSPGKVRRRRSSSRPSFDWKVFEKLCSRSSSKTPVEKSEPELRFMVNWLMKSEALEWIYLLSLLNRDLSSLHSMLESPNTDKKRVSLFLKRVMEGTQVLLNWARDNCPAYVSILKLCSNYLEHTYDQNRLRRYSSAISQTSSSSSLTSMGIPSPPINSLFLGNLPDYEKDGQQHLKLVEWEKIYGDTYGIYEGSHRVLVSSDPDLVHDVLVKQFPVFRSRKLLAFSAVDQENQEKQNLFMCEGNRWKRLRALISSCLTVSQIKSLEPIINGVVNEMMDVIENKNKNGIVDVKPQLMNMGFAIISRCALGYKEPFGQSESLKEMLEAFGKDEIVKSWRYSFFAGTYEFLCITKYLNVITVFSAVAKILKMQRQMRKLLKERMAESAEAKSVRQQDLIDFLMESRVEASEILDSKKSVLDKKVQKKLTFEELGNTCLMFLIAGTDTTANTTVFLLYDLARNKDVQKEVIEEIDSAINFEEDLSYSKVKELDLLERTIKESSRHHPIVTGIIARRAREDTVITKSDGTKITIEKGTCFMPNILSIHMDPKLWGPDPEKFDPDRFLPENSTSRHPMAWLTFGAGPRICPGAKLAMHEVKVAVIKILKNYEIDICPETELKCKMGVLLSVNSMKLKFTKRN